MRKIIASFDLGSDSIKLLVGEINKKKVDLLAVIKNPSEGVKNGLIINNDLASQSIRNSIKKAEEMLGVKINKAIINIPGISPEFLITGGEILIEQEDKVINGNDIVKVLQNSITNKIPGNMELVNNIPVKFLVDEEETDDPKKMIGNVLKVKSVLVLAPRKNVYDILNSFDSAGVEVIDITFNSLADYDLFRNDELDSKTGAIVNIGEGVTTVSIFNKGILTNMEGFEIGGSNIDSDISFIYKVTKDDAKYLKENLALAHKRMADVNESIEITNKLGERIKINQYELSEIVMSRLAEILNLAKKQINLLTKKEISYIIVTGGLTEIKDFNLILEESIGKSVIIGNVNAIGARDNSFVTALGMIVSFNRKLKLRDKIFSILTKEEQEELGTVTKKVSVTSDSIIGKIFGYFFDN